MKLPRFQFTLLSLLFVMLFVAVHLGLTLYVQSRVEWSDLWWPPIALALMALGNWLVLSAPWSARIIALGFLLGVAVENLALRYCLAHDLIHLTPGTWTPEGWYPLGFTVERLFLPGATIAAVFIGMGLSGVVGSAAMLLSWKLWRRASYPPIGRKRSAPMLPPAKSSNRRPRRKRGLERIAFLVVFVVVLERIRVWEKPACCGPAGTGSGTVQNVPLPPCRDG